MTHHDPEEAAVASPEPYISAKALAAALGVPKTRIDDLVRREKIPSYRLSPGIRRFRISEVEAALADDAEEPEERIQGTA